MMNNNYREPEFKVVKALTEDVISTSLDVVSDTWNTNNEDVDINDIFSL
jgi:hypothetical protein